jgi:hypothetical protein
MQCLPKSWLGNMDNQTGKACEIGDGGKDGTSAPFAGLF